MRAKKMIWKYKGSDLTELPEEVVGFVYILHYEDDFYYIGKKLARSLVRRKPLVGMRKNAKRMVWTEHKWREYEGSSDYTDDHTLVAKEIVFLCKTKAAMTYMETDLQFRTSCLVDDKSLNYSILGKFYRRSIIDGIYDA